MREDITLPYQQVAVVTFVIQKGKPDLVVYIQTANKVALANHSEYNVLQLVFTSRQTAMSL